MVFRKSVLVCFLLVTAILIGQDSLKIKLPPVWLNSLYLNSSIENGIERFDYAYKDKKLKNLEYTILIRKEHEKTEAQIDKTNDYRKSNEGNDLVAAKWEMSRGRFTGFDMTGFFKDHYKNGFWKTTYNNKLVKIENYRNGLMVGRYQVYDNNGEILYKTSFGSEGNGIYRDFYFETSVLKEEGRYLGGKKNGEWCSYNKQGKQVTSVQYKNGVLQEE